MKKFNKIVISSIENLGIFEKIYAFIYIYISTYIFIVTLLPFMFLDFILKKISKLWEKK